MTSCTICLKVFSRMNWSFYLRTIIQIFYHWHSCIVNFEYDFREISDKPIEIDEKVLKSTGKIRQTAAQVWTLVTILPLLVGDLIPEDDDHYKCFCTLLKISSIATAREIHVDTVVYMRVLIEEHHVLFKNLYPKFMHVPTWYIVFKYL